MHVRMCLQPIFVMSDNLITHTVSNQGNLDEGHISDKRSSKFEAITTLRLLHCLVLKSIQPRTLVRIHVYFIL